MKGDEWETLSGDLSIRIKRRDGAAPAPPPHEPGRSIMDRVLVIEDDRKTVAEIAAALSDYGFDVVCAYNGREGLLKATTEKFDALVLDRMLPGDLDGLSVLSTL